MLSVFWITIIFTFCKVSHFSLVEQQLIINTSTGQIKGKRVETKSGKTVNAFLGIPYATPPTGKLRFNYPEPIQPWKSTYNADKLPASCPQRIVPLARFHPHLRKLLPSTSFNEDCLKINIWVPVDHGQENELLPVLVYIHGGGFSYGSTTVATNLGDILAAEERIIVASMNYRLASLGFLYLNHTESPGNVGIYDQKLALEWLYTNVQAFGGDPSNIVLSGESAGASSVLFLAQSGKVDHLYNRIVLLSPALKYGVITDHEDNYQKALQLAENVNCPVQNISETIECLRNVTDDELLQSEPVENAYNFLIFKPVADGDLVKGAPIDLISQSNLTKKDVLIGNSKDEASLFLILVDPFVFSITSQQVKPKYSDFIKFMKSFWSGVSDLGRTIVDYQYTRYVNLDNSDKILNDIKHLVNDYIFLCGSGYVADEYAKIGSRVYRFLNTHYPPSSFAPKWFGAYHGSQNIYLFGDLFGHHPKLPDSEYAFSRRLMRYVANFARNGNPNEGLSGLMEPIQWPQYTLQQKDYLIWAPNSTASGSNLRERHCNFWSQLMPKVAEEGNFKLP